MVTDSFQLKNHNRFLGESIGKARLATYKKSCNKMSARACKIRKNMPVYQKEAYGIVFRICEALRLLKPRAEQVVFCKSTLRFYSLDVYLSDLKIAIELDGKQHRGNRKYDQQRDDALLYDFGIIVLRFWNKMVLSGKFQAVMSETLKEQARKKRPKLLKSVHLCHPNPMSI